jgi:hypothetical protein
MSMDCFSIRLFTVTRRNTQFMADFEEITDNLQSKYAFYRKNLNFMASAVSKYYIAINQLLINTTLWRNKKSYGHDAGF